MCLIPNHARIDFALTPWRCPGANGSFEITLLTRFNSCNWLASIRRIVLEINKHFSEEVSLLDIKNENVKPCRCLNEVYGAIHKVDA